MRISGLGTLSGLGNLSPDQIYAYATGAGFPSDVAVTMTAVALRESSGNPQAHNPGPGEDSYGLWQINVQGNPGILSALGLTSPSQLYDPATNAAAAAYLWGGNPNNLNIAWYINRPGYMEAYQQYLPVAQAAADAAGGSSWTDPFGTATADIAGVDDSTMLAFGVGAALFIAGVLG